ncbi:Stromelysin-1, partial [Cucurbita argyrosperma subsp. argyrosperma]
MYLQRFGYITNVQKHSNAMDHDDTFDKAADMNISFEKQEHGDIDPFNGAGKILAHAFPPTDCTPSGAST